MTCSDFIELNNPVVVNDLEAFSRGSGSLVLISILASLGRHVLRTYGDGYDTWFWLFVESLRSHCERVTTSHYERSVLKHTTRPVLVFLEDV